MFVFALYNTFFSGTVQSKIVSTHNRGNNLWGENKALDFLVLTGLQGTNE